VERPKLMTSDQPFRARENVVGEAKAKDGEARLEPVGLERLGEVGGSVESQQARRRCLRQIAAGTSTRTSVETTIAGKLRT
jgi:hypothetical protein